MKGKCLWKAKKSSFGLNSLSLFLSFPLPPLHSVARLHFFLVPVFASPLTSHLLFLTVCLHVSVSHF